MAESDEEELYLGDEDEDDDTVICPSCHGTGLEWEGWPCDYCEGTGFLDI